MSKRGQIGGIGVIEVKTRNRLRKETRWRFRRAITVWDYFLGFVGLSGSGSGLAFGGRPLLEARSTETASGGLVSCSLVFRRCFLGETIPASSRDLKAYIASLHTGLIPALCSIFFVASLFLPELSDNHRTVKNIFSVTSSPFMYMGLICLLSTNFIINFTTGDNLHHKQKIKLNIITRRENIC